MGISSCIRMLTGVSMIGLAGTAAYAQDTQAASSSAAASATSASVPDIVVTGTRLSNPNFTAPTPVTVLNSDTIQQRAPTNIADVVNELPAFRTSRTAAGSGRIADQQSGVQSLIDLRGLGDVRTLVLVNNHRHVGTVTTGSWDTGMIPVGLVDRVEVVTGGASAAYGSDAVSGVTNFILKNKMKGISASIQSGISQRGDGANYAGTLAGGFSFGGDRGHVIAGVDVGQTDKIGNIYSRNFGTGGEQGLLSVSAAQRAALGLPAQQFATGVELANVTPYGLILGSSASNPAAATNGNFYTFDVNGNPVVFNRPANANVFGSGTSAVMQGNTSNYGYNPNAFFNIQNKNQRLVAYGRAEYELSPAITLFGEVNYAHTSLSPTITASYLQSFLVPRTSLPTALQALYTSTNVAIGRIMTENGGGNTTWQSLDMRTYTGGANGAFGKFKWEVYGEHGRTHQDFNTSGLVTSALDAAVYGCNTTATNPNMNANLLAQLAVYQANTGKSCVAFNPLGGTNSAAALNYLYNQQHQDTYITQDVVSADLSGTPFALWAGDVSVAAGAEWRRNAINVVSDVLGNSNIYSQGNFTTYGGSNTVKEVFGEVGVPLLRDVTFAKAFDLNGAIRRTDYRISGAVTTWKVGGTWEPIDGLRFRMTRSRDIRAPNLSELYFVGGALPGSLTNAIAGTAGNGATGTSITGGKGNPNLKPEIADTFTAGSTASFNTGSAGSFRFAVDYYVINIAGAIVRPTTAQSQAICAATLASGATSCPGVTLSSDLTTYPNGIVSLYNLSINLNKLRAQGLDFEAGWRLPQVFGLKGRFEIRALANYAMHLQQYLTVVRADPFETAGSSNGVPHWSGTVTLGYEQNRSGLELQLRGFTGVKYDTTSFLQLTTSSATSAQLVDPSDAGYNNLYGNSISQNRFAGRIYANLSGHIGIGEHLQLFGVINNLLDKAPPLYALISVTNGSRNLNYDLIGRAFRVGVRMNF